MKQELSFCYFVSDKQRQGELKEISQVMNQETYRALGGPRALTALSQERLPSSANNENIAQPSPTPKSTIIYTTTPAPSKTFYSG